MLPAPPGRRAITAAAALVIASIPTLASANGRYPAAGQIALDPADPSTLLVRTTYGVLVTRDAGHRWSWICEGAVGYGGFEDPMVAFTGDGSILAGIFEGLSVSHDSGCQWDFAQGALANRYVIDLSVERADPSRGVLIVSNSAGQDDGGAATFLTQLWETGDDGKTWAQAGVNLPGDFLGLTVDAAPSDRKRVYLSGRLGPPTYPGVLERSDDRGATWQAWPIPGSDDTHLPYIGAIDPNDPSVVYVRLNGPSTDQLVVTKDGGKTWQPSFTTTGTMYGLALSPDGATIALGGDKDGVWTAPTSTLQFTKVSSAGIKCLTWPAADKLYACADEFVDKFTAGVSADEGKTFTPVMHLQALCGPLACGPGTSAGKTCPALWGATAANIGATPCDGATTGSGSTGSGAGSTGSGASGGSGGGSSAGSCALPGAAVGGFACAGSLLGAAAALARRRGRRRPASSRGPAGAAETRARG